MGLGAGPGHPSRSRSPEPAEAGRCVRGAQGIAVRVVKAIDVAQCRPTIGMKRILKIEQFLSAWVVVCRSFRPSFLKTYTV